MIAVQIGAYGGVKGLEVNQVSTPIPNQGEVLVELDYSGINFIDVYMREGHYRDSRTYGTPLPFTLGMEGAGAVIDTNHCAEFNEGDRVAWCLSRGSYSEIAAVPVWKLVKIPQDIDLDIATALMLQGCTAHYLAHSACSLRKGGWCLVHAGAGGVGQILIQLAIRLGARVITTVGSTDKAEIVKRLGAESAIRYRDTDFHEAVMEITDGKGVDVAFDSVGKETIDRSIKCLRARGTCINYGGSSGLVESISPLQLAEAGSVFFTRPHLAHYMADNNEINMRCNDLFAAVRRGELKITIDKKFALNQAAEAMTYLEGRNTKGKLLLET